MLDTKVGDQKSFKFVAWHEFKSQFNRYVRYKNGKMVQRDAESTSGKVRVVKFSIERKLSVDLFEDVVTIIIFISRIYYQDIILGVSLPHRTEYRGTSRFVNSIVLFLG